MEHKNVPTIRFKGFQNEWQNNFLYKLCDISTGYPFDSKLFSNDGQYLVITNSNIQNESRNVDNKVGSKINLLNPTFNNFILNIGDILITMDGTVGRSAIVSKTHNILAQRVGRLSNTNNFNYLYYLLNNGKFHYEMTKLAKGGTIKHISLSDIGKFNTFSSDKDEQTQIGNFFKTFDEQISLQEQKHQKLINLKKAMLEKMFPKEGADVPEIRFKGFTEKWEVKKLIEYLEVSKDKNKNLEYSKNDVLSVSGEFGIVNQIALQGRSFAGASVANYGIVRVGEIVYTKSPLKKNPFGIIKTNRFQTGIVSTLYAIYSAKNNVDSTFVEYYFAKDDRLNKYLNPLISKGAKNDMKVSDENALKGKVIFPKSKEEQKCIAKYFTQLDNLINVSTEQLNKFKNIKQALLQKMFV